MLLFWALFATWGWILTLLKLWSVMKDNAKYKKVFHLYS